MYFLRPAFRTGGILCAAVLTPISKNVNEQSTLSAKPAEDTKTKGWDRVRQIFTSDEFGAITPELNTIYQTIFFSTFVGGCYGGFVHSREAYFKFIERNQATAFVDHFDAKKKLQDYVTINFAKGALKWSWRMALFSGLYVTFVTVMSAYRGKPSLLDYTVGGIVSGSIYQMNMGLRGVIVGGTFGGMVGLFAGSLTMTLFKLTGTTLDEVNEYRYELYQRRQRHLDEAVAKSHPVAEKALLDHHDVISNNKKVN